MFRRFFQVALLGGAALYGAAQAATFTDSKNGFSVTPPAGWQPMTYPGTAVVYMNPKRVKEFGPNINVVVSPIPAGVTQAQFHQASLDQIKRVVTDGKVIQVRTVTLGTQAAQEVVYTGRQGQFELYFIATYAVRGGSAYIVTGTTVIGAQGELAQITRNFVKSFKFTR